MKRALCFVVLTNREAKDVLGWLITGGFTVGFYMYDLARVGTFSGSIDKMDTSTYSIVIHEGETTVFGDISAAMIRHKEHNLVFLTYDEWEELFDGMNPKAVLK